MKRRNFLGLLGLGAVAPMAMANGLIEPVKPIGREGIDYPMDVSYTFTYCPYLRVQSFDRLCRKYLEPAYLETAKAVDRAILGKMHKELIDEKT